METNSCCLFETCLDTVKAGTLLALPVIIVCRLSEGLVVGCAVRGDWRHTASVSRGDTGT